MEQGPNKLSLGASLVKRVKFLKNIYQLVIFLVVKRVREVNSREWAMPCSAFVKIVRQVLHCNYFLNPIKRVNPYSPYRVMGWDESMPNVYCVVFTAQSEYFVAEAFVAVQKISFSVIENVTRKISVREFRQLPKVP